MAEERIAERIDANLMNISMEDLHDLPKKMFDDRLSIKVGSNVNINRENAASWSNVDFSAIAGDFVLEYRLNEKGNYLVRIFHLNDYDIIQDENDYKTGVGFVIRKRLKD